LSSCTRRPHHGYAELGAAFARWRTVIAVTDELPTPAAVRANARYAAACYEAGIVAIVEPEVLMTGSHPMHRCAQVTVDVHAPSSPSCRWTSPGSCSNRT
jgi:fructose-bisphosphate aldolase, class I